jgi:poly(3-hydroxybutyrate) depolymerase
MKTGFMLRAAVLLPTMLTLSGNAVAELDFTVESLASESLSSFNVDFSKSSVSGLSAGAYMADQFFVAFSNDMVGAGIFAGGLYACSEGNVGTALGACMSNPWSIDQNFIQQRYNKAVNYANEGKIDSLDNLQTSKIYVFSGTLDQTVKQEVTDWVDNWYVLAGVPASNIRYKDDIQAGHAIPTEDYGNSCNTVSAPPWMSICNYDGAEAALTHIYGPLNAPSPVTATSGKFIKFPQNEFFSPPNLSKVQLKNNYSMNEFGFAYVPESCQDMELCRIHVVFHGCKQIYDRNPDASDFQPDDASNPFGLQMVKYAGFNEWANTNNLIILYPQAQKVGAPINNPRGCYDWWGYIPGTTDTYATKEGPQMRAVYAMMERIRGEECPGDNQAPTIRLEGNAKIELQVGDVFDDPGATASDPEDGNTSANIVVTGSVDTNQKATYILKYNVSDSEGCRANEVTRTVVVNGCKEWTETNSTHKSELRAYSSWSWQWYWPFFVVNYYAVGSDESLGMASDEVTIRQEDPEQGFYQKGACTRH